MGASFVKLDDLVANGEMMAFGKFEHEAVQLHPGDKGRATIAEIILEKL